MTDQRAANLRMAAIWVVLALLVGPLLSRFVVPNLAADIRQTAALAAYGLSVLLMAAGCAFLARAKGYSPLFGLLGIGYIIGLLVVAVLPDKSKVG